MIYAMVTAAGSSLVDKNNFEYPEIKVSDNNLFLYIKNANKGDIVSLEAYKTFEGWNAEFIKNGRLMKKKLYTSYEQFLKVVEASFYVKLKPADVKLIKKLFEVYFPEKEANKITDKAEKILMDSNLIELLSAYTEGVMTGKKADVLKTLRKRITDITSQMVKINKRVPHFWRDPFKFLPRNIGVGPGGVVSPKTRLLIENYITDIVDRAVEETYQMFGAKREF